MCIRDSLDTCLALRTTLPTHFRAFVTAYMDIFGREKIDHLAEHVFEEDVYKRQDRWKASLQNGLPKRHPLGKPCTVGELPSPERTRPMRCRLPVLRSDFFHAPPVCLSVSYTHLVYYEMAKEAGITMMPSRLIQIEGKHHFLTER